MTTLDFALQGCEVIGIAFFKHEKVKPFLTQNVFKKK